MATSKRSTCPLRGRAQPRRPARIQGEHSTVLGIPLSPANGKSLTILCLGAHSDDIEIGCGGTILRLLKSQACDVHWIVFSAGRARRREALDSARLFLERARNKSIAIRSHRDGFFPYRGAKIKDEFERVKRAVDPDLIFTHYRADLHQDHRLVNELTWNTFRDHFILEYEIPKYDGDLGQPNLFVPVGYEVCEQKVRYLTDAFESQRTKRWFQPETFLGLMRLRGMECNAPSGYAEAFYCRKLVL